jgi:hypothetical protein
MSMLVQLKIKLVIISFKNMLHFSNIGMFLSVVYWVTEATLIDVTLFP